MDLYAFKIYMLDVGLLLAMADLDASVIIDGNRIFTIYHEAFGAGLRQGIKDAWRDASECGADPSGSL